MISTDDLAGMRSTLEESFDDLCTLITPVPTSDGAGGQTYVDAEPVFDPDAFDDAAFEILPPTYRCNIAPRLATGTGQLKDAETIEGQRMIAQAPWMITLPALVEVTATQSIGVADGREFEIFAVLARRSYELDTRLLCRLINDGLG